MDRGGSTFAPWRLALLTALRQRRIHPRDAQRLLDELETHYELAVEHRIEDAGASPDRAAEEALALLGDPETIAKVAQSEHRSVSTPLPLVLAHAVAPTVVMTLVLCAATVFAFVNLCAADACETGDFGPAIFVASGILLVPPLFSAWTMAKARRALLSETWGWVAAVVLGLAAGLVDLQMSIAWPDFVDIDVVWRAEPSVVQFAIPIAAAALTSLGLRLSSALRYTRLQRTL